MNIKQSHVPEAKHVMYLVCLCLLYVLKNAQMYKECVLNNGRVVNIPKTGPIKGPFPIGK